MSFVAPHIDYAGLSPVIALTAGICVVLLAGVIGRGSGRWISTTLTAVAIATTAGLLIWQLGEPDRDLVEGALRIDGLSIVATLICLAAAAMALPAFLRDPAPEEGGFAETHALLLGSLLGMTMLAQSINLISFFVALELLSIPLYALCGTNPRRRESLESGLKYLLSLIHI